MTKQEIYTELDKFSNSDMILVNDKVIIENKDLNDDWFELGDYADDEETGDDYFFSKVTFLDIDNETFQDGENIYHVEFHKPAGCVIRYNIINVESK